MLEVIKTAPSNVCVLSDVVAQISDYYRHHTDASQALADWMAHSFCPQTIFAIINQVLANPALLAEIAARSYHHGNGFLKVVLAA